MSKADTLRIQDVRDIYRVIGECRDLATHPGLWHRRMLELLSVLFGVVQAAGGEAWWDRPGRPFEPVSAYSVSAGPGPDNAFHAYHRAERPEDHPIFRAIQKQPGKLITRTRRQLVSDTDWYPSVTFNEYRKIAGVDHTLMSLFQVTDGGATSGIELNRAIGDRDFTEREQRVLNFFHAEIGRLIGGPLVSATEPGTETLSPRLRQTLSCLLEGDSEKQVATRMRLSSTTVHQYVTTLYRHFGVRSHAQLVVHVIKRFPATALEAPSPSAPDRTAVTAALARDPRGPADSGHGSKRNGKNEALIFSTAWYR